MYVHLVQGQILHGHYTNRCLQVHGPASPLLANHLQHAALGMQWLYRCTTAVPPSHQTLFCRPPTPAERVSQRLCLRAKRRAKQCQWLHTPGGGGRQLLLQLREALCCDSDLGLGVRVGAGT